MTPVDKRPTNILRTDILVVGGGAAGVAAATTAARQGLDVTLVEKYGFCGGGAVAGLSGTVCGLYEATETSENRPAQVVFGFANEFVHRMEEAGGYRRRLSTAKRGRGYTIHLCGVKSPIVSLQRRTCG